MCEPSLQYLMKTMTYFPLFARLNALPCLVVGGGQVAARKVRQLRKAGAQVTVNAPELGAELKSLADQQAIRWQPGVFDAELIKQHQLIIAATDDHKVNQAVAAAAQAQQRFCNVVDDREHSSFIVPAIVDRSPLVIAVSSGGESPVLATRIRQQLDTWLHPSLGQLAAFMGRWRDTVRKHIPPLGERQRFWQTVLAGPVASRVLAGDEPGAAASLQAQLNAQAEHHGIGSLVGAGPGDPELLTLKAVRVLQSADTVLYDRLVAPAVLDLARRDAELIAVGKQGGGPSTPQAEINRLLVEHVAAGKRVCRLKGGDPFVFGRGGEELDALEAAGLNWEVIPGITAAGGCAAAFGLPLTYRHSARSLVLATAQTGNDDAPDWTALARPGQTVVLYMAVARLDTVCAELIAAGLAADCPAALIANGTTSRQQMLKATAGTLAEAAGKAGLRAPALAIFGAAAGMARERPAPATDSDTKALSDVWLAPVGENSA